MKKVLIVANGSEDAENARRYFSQILDYNFIYLCNRKDAEKELVSSDILITDANIPYSEDDSLKHYPDYLTMIRQAKYPFDEKEAYATVTAINGWSLLLLAKAKNIPNLMIGEHGKFKKAEMLKLSTELPPPHTGLILQVLHTDNRPVWNSFTKHLDRYVSENSKNISWFQVCDREDNIAVTNWSLAWQQIQRQLQ